MVARNSFRMLMVSIHHQRHSRAVCRNHERVMRSLRPPAIAPLSNDITFSHLRPIARFRGAALAANRAPHQHCRRHHGVKIEGAVCNAAVAVPWDGVPLHSQPHPDSGGGCTCRGLPQGCCPFTRRADLAISRVDWRIDRTRRGFSRIRSDAGEIQRGII